MEYNFLNNAFTVYNHLKLRILKIKNAVLLPSILYLQREQAVFYIVSTVADNGQDQTLNFILVTLEKGAMTLLDASKSYTLDLQA